MEEAEEGDAEFSPAPRLLSTIFDLPPPPSSPLPATAIFPPFLPPANRTTSAACRNNHPSTQIRMADWTFGNGGNTKLPDLISSFSHPIQFSPIENKSIKKKSSIFHSFWNTRETDGEKLATLKTCRFHDDASPAPAAMIASFIPPRFVHAEGGKENK